MASRLYGTTRSLYRAIDSALTGTREHFVITRKVAIFTFS